MCFYSIVILSLSFSGVIIIGKKSYMHSPINLSHLFVPTTLWAIPSPHSSLFPYFMVHAETIVSALVDFLIPEALRVI